MGLNVENEKEGRKKKKKRHYEKKIFWSKNRLKWKPLVDCFLFELLSLSSTATTNYNRKKSQQMIVRVLRAYRIFSSFLLVDCSNEWKVLDTSTSSRLEKLLVHLCTNLEVDSLYYIDYSIYHVSTHHVFVSRYSISSLIIIIKNF